MVISETFCCAIRTDEESNTGGGCAANGGHNDKIEIIFLNVT